MNKQFKPIKTWYKGIPFRSRLEARWAVFFDRLGIEWEYEPQGYGNGYLAYLPDFKVKCWGVRGEAYLEKPFDLYIEVKGEMNDSDAEKIRAFSGLECWEEICQAFLCSDCEQDYGDCPHGWRSQEPRFRRPVLVVGNIPYVQTVDDVYGNSTDMDPYKPMNGTSIYPFNYETIDGDHFGAYPTVTTDGKFFLMGDDMSYVGGNLEKVFEAYKAARAARFEHGEKG